MATIAVLGAAGVAAPMTTAYAQQVVVIERNNEIDQDIEQEQEACTNEVDVEANEKGKGDQKVKVDADQSNECDVTQTQAAANIGTITDTSLNAIIAANVDLDLLTDILNGGVIPGTTQ